MSFCLYQLSISSNLLAPGNFTSLIFNCSDIFNKYLTILGYLGSDNNILHILHVKIFL